MAKQEKNIKKVIEDYVQKLSVTDKDSAAKAICGLVEHNHYTIDELAEVIKYGSPVENKKDEDMFIKYEEVLDRSKQKIESITNTLDTVESDLLHSHREIYNRKLRSAEKKCLESQSLSLNERADAIEHTLNRKDIADRLDKLNHDIDQIRTELLELANNMEEIIN